ncbi:hypothetical protein JYU34_000908 [Plutella xylostella]|uniref:Uncharacterized protein n=1 Tax=Plutella xylostella TaxID=51655 RepID=A0ABQ7R5K7_PLUXY|nr:hypothetical protein JYU34_000908 [Plutella xylostella]
MKKTTDKENLQKKRQTKRYKKETESEDSSPQEEDDDCACIYSAFPIHFAKLRTIMERCESHTNVRS